MKPIIKFYNFQTKPKEIFHSLKLFDCGIWAFYYYNRFGWLRLFGYGLKWKDISIHKLLFSERNHLNKFIKIGNWHIRFLKRNGN